MKKICGFMLLLAIVLSGCGSVAQKQYSDPVHQAFYSALKLDPEAAEIERSDDLGYLTINYDISKTPYDYTDYVSLGLSDFIKVGGKIFEDTEYTTLRMDMKVDGIAATSLIMKKDNFQKYRWDDMAFTPGIYLDIVDDFDKFYVESMLMKGVDIDQIEYKNNSVR